MILMAFERLSERRAEGFSDVVVLCAQVWVKERIGEVSSIDLWVVQIEEGG